MKKNNRVLRIGLLALVLTLVTASLVSGTFAKYVTTVSGTGTVQVAHWKVQVGPNATYTAGTEIGSNSFNLLNTVANATDVATSTAYKLIAPGTNGKFEIAYDTTGSEVTHDITVNLVNTGANSISELGNLKFTFNNGTNEVTKTASEMSGTTGVEIFRKSLGTDGGSGTITVNWDWPIGTTVAENDADTDDGKAQKVYSFEATFTAVQTNPNT